MQLTSSLVFLTVLALNMGDGQAQYSKLLVTTGSIVGDFARKSEVIDLNGRKTCDPLEDLSFGTMDGTGALLSGQFPLVCGGFVRPSDIRPTTNRCEVLGFPGLDGQHDMMETRDTASSILINPDTLWITGGKHFIEGNPMAVRLASTEYLSIIDESMNGPGPELPIHVWGHCLFANNENGGITLTGGVSNEHLSSAITYSFDFASSSWTEAPKMNIDRYLHGCATFKNEGRTYAIVAGGYSTKEGVLSSVEFLDLSSEDAGWAEGPSMPRDLEEFTLMTSPDEKGVIAVGGRSGSTFSPAIFKMHCTGSLNCEWTELKQNLEFGRSAPVAYLIPDELTNCE